MKKTILLLEDDRNLNRGISMRLEKEGFRVLSAFTASGAEDLFEKNEVHLIISDINLSEGSGLDFCRKIREKSNVYIIFLTALDQEIDIVTGYDMGADDYITKPFNPVVLGAKIKALIRRNKKAAYNAHNFITAGPFRYSNMTLEFFKNEQLIPLSSKENVMMKLFISNVGRVFTKEQLYELVWGNSIVDENAIMVYISHLRNKIEDNPKSPRYIKTVWGLGYKFTVNEGE